MDNLEKALERNQTALEIFVEIGDKPGERYLLYHIGNDYREMGEYSKSVDYQSRALAISRELGEKEWETNSLYLLAGVYDAQGEFETALQYMERAYTIQQATGNKKWTAEFLRYMGSINKQLENYDKVIIYYKQSLGIEKEIGVKSDIGPAFHRLGAILFVMEQYDLASAYFDSANVIWMELDEQDEYVRTLSWWALTEARAGRLVVSKALEVEELLESTNPDDGKIIINWNLFQIYTVLGDSSKSLEYLQRANNELVNRTDELKSFGDQNALIRILRKHHELTVAWDTYASTK